jgi:AcrR family transcriptional regulator
MIIMKKAEPSSAKRPGRPLSFDRDQALHQAMLQFWRTGYETTSVSDLTAAMGITAPSLYAAFGDKESLFLECVEKYTNPGPKPAAVLIAEAPSARQAAQDLLEFSARWFTQPNAPAGCMVASAAASGSKDASKVRAALRTVRQTTQKALQKRAERDIREGLLPETANAQTLSAMTVALIQGLSTLARDGADRKILLEVASTAMKAWPTPPSQ